MKNYSIKIITLLSVFSLFLWLPVVANDHDSLFLKANEVYGQKHYNEAIKLYSEIVETGNEGAVLYYNLGNSYFKLGKNAEALLWYERALRLDPSNEDIKHNILFVNQKLIDKIEVMPQFFLTQWWQALSGSMTSKQWSIVAIICAFLFFLCFALFIITKNQWKRSLSFVLGIIVLFVLTLSILFAHREATLYVKHPEAIIMTHVVTVKSTPDRSGADLFVIHEGLKVKISDKIGDWYEVQMPNGEKGWLSATELEII